LRPVTLSAVLLWGIAAGHCIDDRQFAQEWVPTGSAARRLPGFDGGFGSNVCKLMTIKAIASVPRHF
jgi:hypothetical protein